MTGTRRPEPTISEMINKYSEAMHAGGCDRFGRKPPTRVLWGVQTPQDGLLRHALNTPVVDPADEDMDTTTSPNAGCEAASSKGADSDGDNTAAADRRSPSPTPQHGARGQHPHARQPRPRAPRYNRRPARTQALLHDGSDLPAVSVPSKRFTFGDLPSLRSRGSLKSKSVCDLNLNNNSNASSNTNSGSSSGVGVGGNALAAGSDGQQQQQQQQQQQHASESKGHSRGPAHRGRRPLPPLGPPSSRSLPNLFTTHSPTLAGGGGGSSSFEVPFVVGLSNASSAANTPSVSGRPSMHQDAANAYGGLAVDSTSVKRRSRSNLTHNMTPSTTAASRTANAPPLDAMACDATSSADIDALFSTVQPTPRAGRRQEQHQQQQSILRAADEVRGVKKQSMLQKKRSSPGSRSRPSVDVFSFDAEAIREHHKRVRNRLAS